METTLLKLAYKLKSELSLKVSKEKIKTLLLGHYSYPSIFSFSNALTKLGIDNKIGRISSEEFLKLSPLFLAYSLKDGLVIVKSVSNTHINYLTGESKSLIEESIEDFFFKWNGLVLITEDKPQVKDSKQYALRNKINIFKGVIATILFSTLILFFFRLNFGIFGLIFFSKLLGVIISILLNYAHASQVNELRFCEANKNINCLEVLNSNASSIFKWFSMSDLGLIYFMGGSIAIFISAITGNHIVVMSVLSILSIAVSPYVFFSLYYQYSVIKKWCLYCIYIQAILVMESIISGVFLYKGNFEVSMISYVITGISFLCIVLIWSYLKIHLHKYYATELNQYKYLRLKGNPKVFNVLHQENKIYNTDFEDNCIRFFALPNNKSTTTLVINPYCNVCGEEIEKILSNDYSNLSFTIIFNELENNYITQVLIELYFMIEPLGFLHELSYWFKQRNIEYFENKYQIVISDKTYKIQERHSQWCLQNNIIKTPLLIYENKELSKHYSIEDLFEFDLYSLSQLQ